MIFLYKRNLKSYLLNTKLYLRTQILYSERNLNPTFTTARFMKMSKPTNLPFLLVLNQQNGIEYSCHYGIHVSKDYICNSYNLDLADARNR